MVMRWEEDVPELGLRHQLILPCLTLQCRRPAKVYLGSLPLRRSNIPRGRYGRHHDASEQSQLPAGQRDRLGVVPPVSASQSWRFANAPGTEAKKIFPLLLIYNEGTRQRPLVV